MREDFEDDFDYQRDELRCPDGVGRWRGWDPRFKKSGAITIDPAEASLDSSREQQPPLLLKKRGPGRPRKSQNKASKAHKKDQDKRNLAEPCLQRSKLRSRRRDEMHHDIMRQLLMSGSSFDLLTDLLRTVRQSQVQCESDVGAILTSLRELAMRMGMIGGGMSPYLIESGVLKSSIKKNQSYQRQNEQDKPKITQSVEQQNLEPADSSKIKNKTFWTIIEDFFNKGDN